MHRDCVDRKNPQLTRAEPGLRRAAAIAALIVALWGGWFLWLRPTQALEVEVPRSLLGRWESTDERYVDRFILLNPDTVVWGQGERQLAEPLLSVETGENEETEGHPIIVLVTGDELETSRRSSFFYDGVDSLFPIHRREVRWRKVGQEPEP